jgi:hypothetical protein
LPAWLAGTLPAWLASRPPAWLLAGWLTEMATILPRTLKTTFYKYNYICITLHFVQERETLARAGAD